MLSLSNLIQSFYMALPSLLLASEGTKSTVSQAGAGRTFFTTCPVLVTSNNNHRLRLTQHEIILPVYVCAKAYYVVPAIEFGLACFFFLYL